MILVSDYDGIWVEVGFEWFKKVRVEVKPLIVSINCNDTYEKIRFCGTFCERSGALFLDWDDF